MTTSRQVNAALAFWLVACALSLPALAQDDPALPTTHREVESIDPKDHPGDTLMTIGMDRQGRMIASMTRVQGKDRGDAGRNELVFYNADGKRAETRDLGSTVGLMVHVADDGAFYVGGYGDLLKLDATGKVVKRVDLRKIAGDGKARAAGITTSKDYLFIAVAFGGGLRAHEDIYRLNRDLGDVKKIITNQRGCCNHIDMEIDGDKLIIAENTRFRVNTFDFDGKLLSQWGKRDRRNIEGFASCCNPVGIAWAPDPDRPGKRVLVTAESGVGRLKRYTPEGKYLGFVAYVGVKRWTGARSDSCYIPIEITADGKRMYVMDIRGNVVRVMVAK